MLHGVSVHGEATRAQVGGERSPEERREQVRQQRYGQTEEPHGPGGTEI